MHKIGLALGFDILFVIGYWFIQQISLFLSCNWAIIDLERVVFKIRQTKSHTHRIVVLKKPMALMNLFVYDRNVCKFRGGIKCPDSQNSCLII